MGNALSNPVVWLPRLRLPEHPPGFLLLLDTRDKSHLLRTNLANLRKHWMDAGKPVRTERLRDLEFSNPVEALVSYRSTMGIARAMSGSCVTISKVWPDLCSLRKMSTTICSLASSRLPVGSSAKINFG